MGRQHIMERQESQHHRRVCVGQHKVDSFGRVGRIERDKGTPSFEDGKRGDQEVDRSLTRS